MEEEKTTTTPSGYYTSSVKNKLDDKSYNISTIPKEIFIPGTDNKIWYVLQSIVYPDQESVSTALFSPTLMVNVVNSKVSVEKFHNLVLDAVKNIEIKELKDPAFYKKYGYQSVYEKLQKQTPILADYLKSLGHIFISSVREDDESPIATPTSFVVNNKRVTLFARLANHTFYLKVKDCGVAKSFVLNGKKHTLEFCLEYPEFFEVPSLIYNDIRVAGESSFQ